MKLTVLVDNNTFIDQYYCGEPALCFYIEDGDSKILFDTGYSDIFIHNAKALDIDLSTITDIVFSHGHNDHTRGLIFLDQQNLLRNIQIIAHPDAFKVRTENEKNIGISFSSEELKKKYKLTVSKDPIHISSKITFLGEIPTYFEFEKRKPVGFLQENSFSLPDYVMDDTALAYNTGKGLFIITGCSHSGICNIIQYAKHVCKEEKILGVIGGFHLFDTSEQLNETIAYFEKNNVTKLYPCHCVSFSAKAEIHKHIPIYEVGVGLSINI